jgi:UPF0716 family protein affecting phage T7 exclusion
LSHFWQSFWGFTTPSRSGVSPAADLVVRDYLLQRLVVVQDQGLQSSGSIPQKRRPWPTLLIIAGISLFWPGVFCGIWCSLEIRKVT